MAIQDLYTQMKAVSAEVNNYYDRMVEIISKREEEVLTTSFTAKSYLTSRQSDVSFL